MPQVLEGGSYAPNEPPLRTGLCMNGKVCGHPASSFAAQISALEYPCKARTFTVGNWLMCGFHYVSGE